MKAFLLSIFFAGITFAIYSQDTQTELNTIGDSISNYTQRKLEEITIDSSSGKYLSHEAFNRFFDRYFTLISYEKETFTDGNSAALKVTDNETKLNLTLSKKNNSSIFSIGTALNISDNSGTLFSNNKPTAGTQFFVNHSLLLTPLSALDFNEDFRKSNYQNRRYILDSISSIHMIQRPAMLPVLTHKLSEVNFKIDSLMQRIKVLEHLNIHHDPSVTVSIIESQEKLTDALELKAKINNQLQNLILNKSLANTIKNIKEGAEEASIKRELNAEGVNTFRLQWLSTGISYKRNSYATYDSTMIFSKRIDQKTFDNWSFSAGYNFFWQRTDQWIERNHYKGLNSVYAGITYSGTNSNSYSSINESSLNILRSVTNNDTIYEFSTSQKLRDISGKKFKRDWIHKIGIQGTGMFGKKQFGGINIILNSQLEGSRQPIFNAHVGGLFRFIDSYDEKSKVNFELFIAFNDVTDVNEKGRSVWNRKEIGITASVPFGKVFFR